MLKPLNEKLSYSDLARLEFCAGTPHTAPCDVVDAGIKRITDWSDTLNKHRTQNNVSEYRNREPKAPALAGKRKEVLEYLRIYGQEHTWGATVTEIAKGIEVEETYARTLLEELVFTEEVSLVKQIRVKRNNNLYRLTDS
jgi:hypothetical protein